MKLFPLKNGLQLQIQPYSCCNPQIFPAIDKILTTVLLTTPVGSVSCERSFSALRRLKFWNRSTMNE